MKNRIVGDLLNHIESRIQRERNEDETDLMKLHHNLIALRKDIDFVIDTVDIAILCTYRNIEYENDSKE